VLCCVSDVKKMVLCFCTLFDRCVCREHCYSKTHGCIYREIVTQFYLRFGRVRFVGCVEDTEFLVIDNTAVYC